MIRTEAAKEVMIAASRAGINKESIGNLNNTARRWQRLGNTKYEAECLREALQIHNTWGARLEEYSMSPGTLERVTARLSEIS